MYFANYAVGTEGRKHLRDENEFFKTLANTTLPHVSFIKPGASDNQHPGYASLMAGDDKLDQIVKAVRSNKKVWNRSIIIVTYDENGGLWDHAAAPEVDRWGPGTRVPAVIISPMYKKGFIDHTFYDTTSILKLIESRFGLQPLGERDKRSKSLIDWKIK